MSSASYKSVVEMFRDRVGSTPDAQAMLFKRDGAWTHMDWRAVGDRVHLVACGLRSLGLENEQRCSILAKTMPDWIVADIGILSAAGATTTIYPSNTAEECAYIINDSGTRFVFVEDAAQADKLRSVRGELEGVVKLITFGDGADGAWVITMAELLELGRAWDREHPGVLRDIGDAIEPDHLATIIYTSGTTGKPKGVMLTHDCWIYEGEAIDNLDILLPSDKQYLFLPLAHSFAKVMELAFIRMGIPTVVDGDQDALIEQLAESSPTFMACVPRIFEKVYNKVVESAKAGGKGKWAVFQWALSVGKQVSTLRQQGKEPTGMLRVQYRLAKKLVFSKIEARFGGRMRFFISGGAPLSKEIAEFFHAADILILEGYGLTETSAATFVNRPDAFKFGTVGPPLAGTRIKLDDDGEILLKGRGVMRGYYNRPDDTAEVFTEDGWFRTGDIGAVDDDGFLAITDRKKDIIVTAGGKNVAPQNIENLLKARCPYISQAVVHGDKRNFCTAIITIDETAVGQWAKEQQIPWRDYADLASKPQVVRLIQQGVDQVNSELARYESIKKFHLLDHELSIESGELTPKMSIKRRVVEQNYMDILDAFYEGSIQRF
jgi:long-chain acyl-CoA synthetase